MFRARRSQCGETLEGARARACLLALLTTREIGQVPSEHQLYSNAACSVHNSHRTLHTNDCISSTQMTGACGRPCIPSRQPELISHSSLRLTTIIAVAFVHAELSLNAFNTWSVTAPLDALTAGHACTSRTVCGNSLVDLIRDFWHACRVTSAFSSKPTCDGYSFLFLRTVAQNTG